jgi:two-component system response regulator GlrR
MDERLSIHLFDFCHNLPLCETFVATLKNSFESEGELRLEVVNEFLGEGDFYRKLESSKPHVVLLILRRDQLQLVCRLIQGIKAKRYDSEIIVIPEGCEAHEILDLIKLGASDFIIPPVNVSTTMPRIWRVLEKSNWRDDPTQSLKAKLGLKLLVGKAPVFMTEIRKIPLLASCDGRVLILGETGTGKELFARAIHYLSSRMRHPFVAVSCGAIPVELLENELFGHNKGAFTGALAAKLGLIREAEGGTLFLDEIDSLPLLAQTKLLRFLQEGEYRSLGSSKSRQADVRVIAASNANLGQAVKEGKLRQDLYYRLNIVPLNLPPLRERREDIPLLAEHFLMKYATEFRRNVSRLSDAAMRKLIFYDWPGNIRELENTIERAVMLTSAECIRDTEIFLPDADMCIEVESFQESKAKIITNFERSYIQGLMVTYHGNVSHAARAAKKNRRALWELIRKHNIDVGNFRTHAGPSKTH